MILSPLPLTGGRRGVTVKALKTVLKKNGMKTTGKKATLTRRVKKARLMGGQLTTAVKKAAETAKGVVGVGEALVRAPIKGVKAALNSGKGGRR
jgi:hypothetical protein